MKTKTYHKTVNGDQEIVGYLYDQSTKKDIEARVSFVNGMITINIDGYGDLTSNKGQGEPILIESFDDNVRVVLWGDINSEEATHIIKMDEAKESNRNEDN